jgi:hypothetical protein
MSETPAEKFFETITSLLHLWQTVRVSGMASYDNGQWFNVGIRVQLLENPPTSADIQSPDRRFLYYVIDMPLKDLQDTVGQLTRESTVTIEKEHGAGSFVEISLKPARPESGLGVSWYPPSKREPTPQQRTSGIRRTSIALVSSGQMLQEVLDQDLRNRLNSKLRFAEPAHDGLAGLSKVLFPGAGFENWQMTLVEIIAELPFEIESTNEGNLAIRASTRAKDGSLTAIAFYEPSVGLKPVRSILRRNEAALIDLTLTQWNRLLDWPGGAERAKITLFYQEEEIQSVQLTRRTQAKADSARAAQRQSPRPASVVPTPHATKQQANSAAVRPMPIFRTALEVYRSLGTVGSGGAGIVYKVQTDDGQIFAIKCLDFRKATAEKRKRFKTELYFCSKNEHKNIITVLDQGIFSINGEDSCHCHRKNTQCSRCSTSNRPISTFGTDS